ncbi:hypothetical protein [Microbispora sitophila]|uniref:hypothetical protein n=1 Tax=Microbispora sitophila TaxID=2771537 RepID=UPI001D021989|nr:hypothetical protein [Microbispora sitophila]
MTQTRSKSRIAYDWIRERIETGQFSPGYRLVLGWWGNPVVPSRYTEASAVLDLDGNPVPVVERTHTGEMAVTVGADGFSYTRVGDVERGFKLGEQL